jgi:hypothetical protein
MTRTDQVKNTGTPILDLQSCCPGDFIKGLPTSNTCHCGQMKTEEEHEKCWGKEEG